MIPEKTIQQLEKALPDYLPTRRWFRSKALTITEVKVSSHITLDGFTLLFLEISYLQGGQDLYLLPVTSQPLPDQPITILESEQDSGVAIYDALASPFFRTILLREITSGLTSGPLISKSSITLPPVDGIVESFVSKAEQSNSSIIYGHDYILKVFRKLEPGINPDIEIGAFLTAQGFKNTPATLATLAYQPDETASFFAAILQQFVPNQGDAWKYTLTCLASFDGSDLGTYSDSAKLLGIRTAQMHTALASDKTNPDFAPEPFTSEDAKSLASEISRQATSTLALLETKLDALSITDQPLAQQVLNLKQRITQRFTALAAISTSAKRIRYHGDYHLGQVLYTGSDFMIIDFEGEPARPLSERRAKALALRDVAGMLRSFQYAAYSGPSAELADSWFRQVSKLYLDAYLAEAGSQPFLPATPEQRTFFLNAFLLQKALYEVQYELNNRPAWVGIPLRGILSLTET
jgi:maltose alpha-D-glucosyltransferase/alpha-amylase